MKKYKNKKFFELIEPIIYNQEFQKLKCLKHHGISRYEHCLRVANMTYTVTKKFHLNYKEATVAALLHDFFTTEVQNETKLNKLKKHPRVALKNSLKYYELTNLQKDIILTHMFPVTLTPPKYIESWLVDLLDDVSAIKERSVELPSTLKGAYTLVTVMLINILKIK